MEVSLFLSKADPLKNIQVNHSRYKELFKLMIKICEVFKEF